MIRIQNYRCATELTITYLQDTRRKKWTRTINKLTKIFWYLVEKVVMIHRTPTVQNQPVYTPVSSSHPVTTVPAEVGKQVTHHHHPTPHTPAPGHSSGLSGGGDRRENRPAEHTSPQAQALCLPSPKSTRIGTLQRCPQTTAVTASHVEKCRIIGK